MPQFPHLSVGMTMLFENLEALWLEVTASAVLLQVPETDTIYVAILVANVLFHEKFMPYLKHFCKHKHFLRTLAPFKYPATFLNVVAFPVFILPPPGPFAQQTGWVFFIWLCLPGASIPGAAALAELAQGRIEAPEVVAGMPRHQEEMHGLRMASSPACVGGRTRNLDFLGGRSMGPPASPLPAGAGQKAGRPPVGHAYPGLLCALGSQCAQQLEGNHPEKSQAVGLENPREFDILAEDVCLTIQWGSPIFGTMRRVACQDVLILPGSVRHRRSHAGHVPAARSRPAAPGQRQVSGGLGVPGGPQPLAGTNAAACRAPGWAVKPCEQK